MHRSIFCRLGGGNTCYPCDSPSVLRPSCPSRNIAARADPRPYKVRIGPPNDVPEILAEFATVTDARACLADVKQHGRDALGDSLVSEFEIVLALRTDKWGRVDLSIPDHDD